MSTVAGQVQPDLQLGLNFGVEVSGGDEATTTDSLLSLDMSKVSGMVVVTGLTVGCDPTPTLITCHMSPTDPATQAQSMTLTAAPGVAAGTTGTISLYTSWPDDTDSSDDVATIELTVIIPAGDSGAQDATQPATPPANAQSPPVVIGPLPTLTTSQQNLNAPLTNPRPGVTLTPTLGQVPRALRTRQPGFIQTGPDGKKYVVSAGNAPTENAAAAALGSPVFLVALGASSMGLLAILLYGIVNARRVTRPPSRALRASDPTRPNRPLISSSNEPTRPDRPVYRP